MVPLIPLTSPIFLLRVLPRLAAQTPLLKLLSMLPNIEGKIDSYMGDCLSHLDHSIDIELIDHIIHDLKVGKAAGLDSLTVEHFKYSHPIVTSILVKLF